MPLSRPEAEYVASRLHDIRESERPRLDKILAHIRGDEALSWLPPSAPHEVVELARTARVPMLRLIVKNVSQQMALDDYRSANDSDGRIWNVWQVNRMDRKQIRPVSDTSKFGVAYGMCMPTTTLPEISVHSPTQITTSYSDTEEDWPQFALMPVNDQWLLMEPGHVHRLAKTPDVRYQGGDAVFFTLTGEPEPTGLPVVPVVRYLSDEDSDDPIVGDVEPLIPRQVQLNLTNFHLVVAQHYSAHGRQIIIGSMMRELEDKIQRNGANQMMTLNADPDEVRVDQIDPTPLSGFIESERSILQQMAALGQTPVQELQASMAQMSAEALNEAKESADRKISQRETIIGESHEQLLGLAGTMLDPPVEFDPGARVRWKPTRNRRMLDTLQVLVTLHRDLGVPVEAVIEHLPFDRSDVQTFLNSI